MHRIERAAVVPYTPERMYHMVADVESYPQFIPGCSRARVSPVDEHNIDASLEVSKGPFRHWFTTRNTLRPTESISLALIDGPFRALSGEWTFRERDEGGTEIALRLEFDFSSRLMGRALAPAFAEIAKRMVGAFGDRARALYGDDRQ